MAQRSGTAIRYAEAVFQVAREDQSYDLWLRELGEVEHLLADRATAHVLTSPAVPKERKASILAETLPGLSEPVRRFLDLLLRRDRLELVPRVLEALRELANEARGLETARVTTAVSLGPAEKELVAERLSARTGKRVQVEERVDPELIGGVVAQIGDQIIDGSVRGRLERLRRSLAGT
jgi:F-type H+-transporting ATPase subunit delta